jgi:hypothetical protein
MPYIKKDDRKKFAQILELVASGTPTTCGELNYLITKICHLYVDANKQCYQTMNDIVGALECAKFEFYRRDIAHYEETKIKENGDIYEGK